MSLSVTLAVSAAPPASGAAFGAMAIIITSASGLIIGSGAAAS
jgi:hypothetical protein